MIGVLDGQQIDGVNIVVRGARPGIAEHGTGTARPAIAEVDAVREARRAKEAVQVERLVVGVAHDGKRAAAAACGGRNGVCDGRRSRIDNGGRSGCR